MANFDEPVEYKKDSVIFCEGELSNYLYIVVYGEIRLFKEDNERLIPISVIKEKDFIGELSIFSDRARSVSAVAAENSKLILIKKKDARKVIKDCPDWVSNIMNTLCDRLRGSLDVLREHRIVDTLSDEDLELDAKTEKHYRNLIQEHKKRRAL